MGVLGLIGYVVLRHRLPRRSCAPPSSPAYVLPSLADTDPGYVTDVLAAATGHTPTGDIGLLGSVLQVQGLRLSGRRPALRYRAVPSARPRSAGRPVLLAVSGVVTVALAVMPDAFYRFLAFPNAIAMIALGYSLWRVARIDTPALPTPVDRPSHRHHGGCRMSHDTVRVDPEGADAAAPWRWRSASSPSSPGQCA